MRPATATAAPPTTVSTMAKGAHEGKLVTVGRPGAEDGVGAPGLGLGDGLTNMASTV